MKGVIRLTRHSGLGEIMLPVRVIIRVEEKVHHQTKYRCVLCEDRIEHKVLESFDEIEAKIREAGS